MRLLGNQLRLRISRSDSFASSFRDMIIVTIEVNFPLGGNNVSYALTEFLGSRRASKLLLGDFSKLRPVCRLAGMHKSEFGV